MVVLIVAAVLGLMGKKALDKAQPAPERAIDQAQQTIAVIKKPFGEPGCRRRRGRCRRGRRRERPAPGVRRDGTARRRRARRAGDHRPRQPETHAPVDTGRRVEHAAAQHRRDLVEGERVAGVRVVERGREDHADDLAAPVEHRPAGRAAAHLRPAASRSGG